MTHYLLVYNHPELGEQRFELEPNRTYRMGSRSGNDIVIPQRDVSRDHAVLRVSENGFHITDLKSKNGTQVNGRPVASADFHCGDELMLSSARMMIMEVSSGTFALAPEIRPTERSEEKSASHSETEHYRTEATVEDMVALMDATADAVAHHSPTELLRWIKRRFRFQGMALVYREGRRELSLLSTVGDMGPVAVDPASLLRFTREASGPGWLRHNQAVCDVVVNDEPFLAGTVTPNHTLVVRYGVSPPAVGDLCVILSSLRAVVKAVRSEGTGLKGDAEEPSREDRDLLRFGILGSSPAITRCKKLSARYARQEEPVMITGESGTGKELFARAIHQLSCRSDAPFVAVNCAAIPSDLIEAELFGVASGAATGVGERKGKFQTAAGGTLLLDEVGDLPLLLQGKLLRVLEEGELYRVGDDTPVKCDVRIISATNRDLEEDVQSGRFRQDLYYRLYVLRIHVPPLRERRGDIPCLVNAFVEESAARMNKQVNGLTVRALTELTAYDWPGNVRELRSEVIRAVASVTSGAIIDVENLSIRGGAAGSPESGLQDLAGLTLSEARERVERFLINAALEGSDGNRTRAADQLGLSRAGLFKKMKKLNL